MSVPRDVEVEAPLIYCLRRRKVKRKEGLLSSTLNPTGIYAFQKGAARQRDQWPQDDWLPLFGTDGIVGSSYAET